LYFSYRSLSITVSPSSCNVLSYGPKRNNTRRHRSTRRIVVYSRCRTRWRRGPVVVFAREQGVLLRVSSTSPATRSVRLSSAFSFGTFRVRVTRERFSGGNSSIRRASLTACPRWNTPRDDHPGSKKTLLARYAVRTGTFRASYTRRELIP